MKEKLIKEVLRNGITIVTEKIPYVRSASISIWIKTGSRFEKTIEENGISHFIEHMVFKGTKNRTAKEIAEEMDSIGGQLDAFTGREHTCFYAKVMDKHTSKVFNLLSDVILNPRFSVNDIEKEKKVITEEIKMYMDSPDEYIHDMFVKNLWGDHPLGRPILGNEDAVNKLSRESILQFYRKQYSPKNMVIAVAGNIEHSNIVKFVKSYLGSWDNGGLTVSIDTPVSNTNCVVETKKLEQVHICIGTKGLPYNHKDRYILYVLNDILGGSVSSRLFQEVREKRALAYSISSLHDSYIDTGIFFVYAATNPDKVSLLIKTIKSEFKKIREGKVSKDELKRIKEQLKSNFILSLENTTNRMIKLAKQELYFGKQFTVEEIIKNIDRVKDTDIQRLARELLGNKNLTLVCLGPISGKSLKKSLGY